MKTIIALLLATSACAIAQLKDPPADEPPKITIEKDMPTDDLVVTVEATETKPTDVSIDIDGQGFLFLFRFYDTNTFKVFPSIRRQPTVLFKAEKGQVVPGDIPIDVQPVVDVPVEVIERVPQIQP
jgi:hypothetical protein